MKRIMLSAVLSLSLAAGVFAAEGGAESAPSLGLTLRMDYASTYLWRGTYFFGGDGAFLPTVIYDVAGSGLVLSFIGEFSQGYFFEGAKRDRNKTGFANHGLDFGADYSHTFGDAFTVGAGFWYYWYFNSSTAEGTSRTNLSFLTAKGFARIDMLPLSPTVTVYYDYYTAIRRGGDIYVTLGGGHEFPLTDEVSLGVSVSAGYYYQNTAEAVSYAATVEEITRTPVKKGFSDITTLVNLIYTKGPVSLNGGFGYVAVPARTWHKGQDVHRFYATFGGSYTF
ncbi:MAG: hypothetical protein JXA20_07055 [Spirochaetes bacterium]|nr:hypothetical protein [Spirochaetota bacterium]